MVRIAGLEPANRVVSSLLIVAFRYTSLLWSIQHCLNGCKHYFATICNDGQEILCRAVSGVGLVSGCVSAWKWPDSVSGCVGTHRTMSSCGHPLKARCSPCPALWQRTWRALAPRGESVRLPSASLTRRQPTAKHSFFGQTRPHGAVCRGPPPGQAPGVTAVFKLPWFLGKPPALIARSTGKELTEATPKPIVFNMARCSAACT